MESAVDRFQRVLDENNLTASFPRPQIKYIENGGIIIEQPLLQISFTDPKKEVKDATPEQTTTPIDGETVKKAQK